MLTTSFSFCLGITDPSLQSTETHGFSGEELSHLQVLEVEVPFWDGDCFKRLISLQVDTSSTDFFC